MLGQALEFMDFGNKGDLLGEGGDPTGRRGVFIAQEQLAKGDE